MSRESEMGNQEPRSTKGSVDVSEVADSSQEKKQRTTSGTTPALTANHDSEINVKSLKARLDDLETLPSLRERSTSQDHASQAEGLDQGRNVDIDATAPGDPPHASHTESDFVDSGLPVPDTYGYDRVVAMMRSSEWIYVYWELSGGALERLRFQYSAHIVKHSRWILKVQSSQLQEQWVDIDVTQSHWWVKVKAGGRYKIELGFVNPDGIFESLASSRIVYTPSTTISSVCDDKWNIGKADLGNMLQASGGTLNTDELQYGAKPFQEGRRQHPRARGLI